MAVSIIPVPGRAHSRKSRNQAEIWSINYAMQAYKAHYGRYPTGKSLQVIKTLRGDNPARIEFLDWSGPYRAVERNGMLIDEWGAPYLISSAEYSFAVRSAGPDGRFNTADDRFIERSPSATNIQTLH